MQSVERTSSACDCVQWHGAFLRRCTSSCLLLRRANLLHLCRRGRWTQASTETDAFEVVNLADWQQLMVFYGEDSNISESHRARRCAPHVHSTSRFPRSPQDLHAVLTDEPHDARECEVLMALALGRPITATLIVDAPAERDPSKVPAKEEEADKAAADEVVKPSVRGTDESARAHLATDPDWCCQVWQSSPACRTFVCLNTD